jgi:hypothetical protein
MRWSPRHPARATLSQGVFISQTITLSDLALVGIGLDKHTFHLHGQDKPGRELFRKKHSRQQMMRFFANLPACTVMSLRRSTFRRSGADRP